MEITKARNCKVGTKLCYDWQIDTGVFEYNANPEDIVETEETESRFARNNSRRNEPVENKQPLIARRGGSQTPF